MITGRSAPASSAIASSIPVAAAGSASGSGSGAAGGESSPSEKTMSSGKSMKVGPECGASAVVSASSIRPGIASGLSAVAANFVSGATNGMWSISCSEPIPQRSAGARPPRTMIGDWFCSAEPTALSPLVTPGPAVSAATPGWRVTLAQPSAANVAACSWRVSTISIPSSRHPS